MSQLRRLPESPYALKNVDIQARKRLNSHTTIIS